MLKIVIADDEARICSLIRMLIDWEGLEMELAGVAANGLEALELVRRRKPDILITDIRMPGCHGLELIERAKQIQPQLEVIIISGYAHFEYAQSAIRFGVGDYLLKPINQRELMDTLSKLRDRLLHSRQLGSEVERLRKSSREDQQKLRSRLMQDLVSGKVSDPSPELLWERYRFSLQEGRLLFALLDIDYDMRHTAATAVRMVEEKASKVFSKGLSPLCHTLLIHVENGEGGFLLGFGEEQAQAIRGQLRVCLNQLEAQGDMLGGFVFSLSVSGVMGSVQELGDACEQLHVIRMERLMQGTGRMLESVPEASPWRADDLLRGFRQAVCEPVERLTIEGAEQAVTNLRVQTLNLQRSCGRDVFELVRTAAQFFFQQPLIEDGGAKYERFLAMIRRAPGAQMLFDMLRDAVCEEIRIALEQQRSMQTRPIRLAREYVHRHYSEPITLERVSEEVGFSVSYFSALFKKETGESFLRYLTRIRMEKAKELLAQTNEPVSQICSLVGYSDLKHFTQTFRKETNLSPGQYRKLYG